MTDRAASRRRLGRLFAALAPCLVAAASAAAGGPALLYHEAPDDPPAAAAARDDAAARTPGRRIRVASYLSVQVNVDELGLNIRGDAANEPSIAFDPLDPSTLVIGWRQFNSVNSNFRQAGWGYSHDAGATWTFPGVLQPGVFRSDPVLTETSDGTIYYNSLQSDFSMDFWRSLNGGISFQGPVEAFGGDKNWAVVDRSGGTGEGHIYGTWQRGFSCCGPDTFTRSINDGVSFQSPVPVTNSPSFGNLAVGPDGEVYAAGVEGTAFGQDFNTFVVSRSDNADNPGVAPTFTGRAVPLGGAMVLGGAPNPDGLLGQAWVAVDRGAGASRGHVYLLASVNPSGTDPMDVRIARSIDGGESWEPSVRVNDDPETNRAWQWFGTIAVAPNRRLDVVWNDTRDSGDATISRLTYSYSYDGGKTWSANLAITPAWDSTIGWPNQFKIGDYYDMKSDDLGADLAYAATFNGEQDVYYVRLFPDCNGNGISDVADVVGGGSEDANGDDIPDECPGLALSPAVPGEAGEVNQFAVRGAAPGAAVTLVASLTAGSTAVPGCSDLAVALAGPQVLGSAVADAAGEATIAASLPPQLAGRTFLAQAVERTNCRASNVLTQAIP